MRGPARAAARDRGAGPLPERLRGGRRLTALDVSGWSRHEFKRAIAEQGKGDVDRLVAAYKRNFEAWRDGPTVHVRYGETSSRCYCPVVKDRPARAEDLHCECTRSTHQSIFETARGRPIRVEVVEALRRGGRTCHFLANVA